MAENSAIEWTDHTFNPWIGCTKVSPGCDHCYAEARMDTRLHVVGWGAGQPRKRTSASNWAQPTKWNAERFAECAACRWRGKDPHEGKPGWIECPACGTDALAQARQRVFCASLADVFDNEVPVEWRADLLMLIRATPHLDWLLLTKRIGNAMRLLQEVEELLRAQDRLDGWDWLHDWTCGSPPANVWLGATIVNQEEADRDIPKLLATPARVRFLSMEPLLGPVEFSNVGKRLDAIAQLGKKALAGIDWVIVGGESGPHARPMALDWARALREQCTAAGAPFLFKQWGEYVPAELNARIGEPEPWRLGQDGRRLWNATESLQPPAFWPPVTFWKPGKKAAGRLLDGVEHNGFPEAAP